jgi:hypothetical protein
LYDDCGPPCIKHGYVRQIRMKDFRKHSHGRRRDVLNSWNFRIMLLTTNGGRGTMIRHSVFLDETPGPKRSVKNESPHSAALTGSPKSKSSSRSSETVINLARIFLVPGDHPWLWGPSLRHFDKNILLSAPGWPPPLPYDRPCDSRHSPERVGDEKILTALGAQFSKSRSKICSSWSTKSDVANFPRIQSTSLWRNRNGRRVLVLMFLSMPQNVCIVTSRCRSEDAIGNRCEPNSDHGLLHRMETNHSRYSAKMQQISSVNFYGLRSPDLQRVNINFRGRIPQVAFEYIWIIQYTTMDQKGCWNLSSLTFHDCPTRHIR